MFKLFEKKDSQIKSDVQKELKWDPSVSDSHISVSSQDGIVTLSGSVPHFYEKSCAEKAAQRVSGVLAVADEIEVNVLGIHEKSDEEIAKLALTALNGSYFVPKNLKVVVSKGWINLSGQVDWSYQKNAAIDIVRPLMGVRGVSNEIVIKPAVKATDIKVRIEESLLRAARSDAKAIKVSVDNDHVTLSGHVHTFSEIADAGFAAWCAPGVNVVENNLKVGYSI